MIPFTEIIWDLVTWTPFLAGGFAMNILISLVAMTIGTSLGWIIANMRLATSPRTYRASLYLTEITRNIPTFVFLFYLAFMLPGEFTVPFTASIVGFPSWLKASLALSIAVIGFCSDNLSPAIREWRKGDHGVALLFIPSWTSYALIIVMASSTASVIGVSDGLALQRSNATGKADHVARLPVPASSAFAIPSISDEASEVGDRRLREPPTAAHPASVRYRAVEADVRVDHQFHTYTFVNRPSGVTLPRVVSET